MSYFDDPAPLGSSFLPSAGFAPCVPAPAAAGSRQVSRESSRNDLSELFDASEELFEPISLPAPLPLSPPREALPAPAPLPSPPAVAPERKQQQQRPDDRAAAQKFRMRYYAKLQQLAATAPRQPPPPLVCDEGGYSTEDSVSPAMSRESSSCSLSSMASSTDLEESPCASPQNYTYRRSPPIAIPARRPALQAKAQAQDRAERSRLQQKQKHNQKRAERYPSPSQDREDEDERDNSDDEGEDEDEPFPSGSPRSSLLMSRRKPLYQSGFSLAFDFSMPPPVRKGRQLGRY